jgi:acyl carrier protein
MIDRAQVEGVVLQEIAKLLEEEKVDRVHLSATDGLIESGMDSLGFAVLVTRLEESLGYDPFMALEEEIYPRTVAELVDVYATFPGSGGTPLE